MADLDLGGLRRLATGLLGSGEQADLTDPYVGNNITFSGEKLRKEDDLPKNTVNQAINSDVMYSSGYEGHPMVNDPEFREDHAALRKYGNRSAIVSLGIDPGAMKIRDENDAETSGSYRPGNGLLQSLFNPPDEISLNRGDGLAKPDGFNSRVAAHESAHRGLHQLVNAVYGRDIMFGDDKAAWVDTSVFTPEEKQALDRLKGIVENADENRKSNEYLTRIIESKITGNPMAMDPVKYESDDPNGYYGKINDQEEEELTRFTDLLESAAQKVIAQQRRSGPR